MPTKKPAAAKPVAKKPAAKKPAAPKAKASVAAKPAAKKAPAKSKAAPAKKATAKETALEVKIAGIKVILEGFEAGGITRSEGLSGKISPALKEALAAKAKELGVAPATLVAAIVTQWLISA